VTPPFPHSTNPFKTGPLAETYTKTYTVAPSVEGKAHRFKKLPLTVKHLKSVAAQAAWEFEPPSRHLRFLAVTVTRALAPARSRARLCVFARRSGSTRGRFCRSRARHVARGALDGGGDVVLADDVVAVEHAAGLAVAMLGVLLSRRGCLPGSDEPEARAGPSTLPPRRVVDTCASILTSLGCNPRRTTVQTVTDKSFR